MATRGPDWQCHPRRLERGYVAQTPSSTGRGRAAVGSGLTVPLPFKTLGWTGQGLGNLDLQIKKCICSQVIIIQCTWLERSKTMIKPSNCLS